MPADPQLEFILSVLNAGPSLRTLSPEENRAHFRAATVDLRDPATLPQVRSVEDTTYPAAEGDRAARIYRPFADGPVPTILFVHGGGFVIGSIDTHDDQARLLCTEVGAVVISIDYRLAPENPFPAAYEDVSAALRHVCATVSALGGDPARIAIAGDSAGGNLSAGVAIRARDEGLPLAAQLLIYPSTDFTETEHPSRIDNAEGYFLSLEDLVYFAAQYAADPTDTRASVLHHPDLHGLAPAVIATAELDPLRDEGEAYADLLAAAGVTVTQRRYDGTIHGFFGLGFVHDVSHKASLQVCADLKELLT